MDERKEWQVVCDEGENVHIERTSKLKVEGGWLYRFERLIPVCGDFNNYGVAMQFVPKPPTKAKVKVKRRKR